jgi:hypothetical protein
MSDALVARHLDHIGAGRTESSNLEITKEWQDLATSERHLREGAARIADQHQRIALLEAAEQDANNDRNLLSTFERTLEQWREHHLNILDRIARAAG